MYRERADVIQGVKKKKKDQKMNTWSYETQRFSLEAAYVMSNMSVLSSSGVKRKKKKDEKKKTLCGQLRTKKQTYHDIDCLQVKSNSYYLPHWDLGQTLSLLAGHNLL